MKRTYFGAIHISVAQPAGLHFCTLVPPSGQTNVVK